MSKNDSIISLYDQWSSSFRGFPYVPSTPAEEPSYDRKFKGNDKVRIVSGSYFAPEGFRVSSYQYGKICGWTVESTGVITYGVHYIIRPLLADGSLSHHSDDFTIKVYEHDLELCSPYVPDQGGFIVNGGSGSPGYTVSGYYSVQSFAGSKPWEELPKKIRRPLLGNVHYSKPLPLP